MSIIIKNTQFEDASVPDDVQCHSALSSGHRKSGDIELDSQL